MKLLKCNRWVKIQEDHQDFKEDHLQVIHNIGDHLQDNKEDLQTDQEDLKVFIFFQFFNINYFWIFYRMKFS